MVCTPKIKQGQQWPLQSDSLFIFFVHSKNKINEFVKCLFFIQWLECSQGIVFIGMKQCLIKKCWMWVLRGLHFELFYLLSVSLQVVPHQTWRSSNKVPSISLVLYRIWRSSFLTLYMFYGIRTLVRVVRQNQAMFYTTCGRVPARNACRFCFST